MRICYIVYEVIFMHHSAFLCMVSKLIYLNSCIVSVRSNDTLYVSSKMFSPKYHLYADELR